MIRRKPFTNRKPDQTDPQVISVTELAWAVSKVLNFVSTTNQSVKVTNRGRDIAVITPPAGIGSTSGNDHLPKGVEG